MTGPAGSLPSGAGARMAIGPHDEILILFSNYPPCEPPFGCSVGLTVARYTPEGQLDPSFAAASPQLTVKQSALENEFDLAVGSDGKPVVAAYGGTEGGWSSPDLASTGSSTRPSAPAASFPTPAPI